ncbi:MAG: HAMP domain-containing protein [Trueperaceae bacterium]
MSQAVVVEVTEKPEITSPHSLESLARAFNISPRKVELMLKRLPGVATKPISEQEAAVVMSYFEGAGLKARVTPATAVVRSTQAPSAPSQPPAPSRSPVPASVLPRASSSARSSGTGPAMPKVSEPTTKPKPLFESAFAKAELGSPPPSIIRQQDSVKLPFQGDVAVANLPQVETSRLYPTPDLLQALGESASSMPKADLPNAKVFLDSAATGRRTSSSNTASSNTATLPTPPEVSPFASRPDHDVLRTTLLGDAGTTQVDNRKIATSDTAADVFTGLPTGIPLTKTRTQHSGQVSYKLLLTAVVPALLTFAGTLAMVVLVLWPFLTRDATSVAQSIPVDVLWQLLGSVAVLSLVPLSLALLFALLTMRPIAQRIRYLTEQADEISRGQLSKSIEVEGDDELSGLAEALERLRVSMQGALERLRRRR